ncbi:YCII-related protein [Sphingobium chlorophenolicum L-1]|uniref:YCII-related protein n=1 Tax=Sphingobium chlorophenolicum L-1 TaxID=690566 RepID=F6F295_SPHCR|nr:YciI family protein [Sphingobium chlorophenolicum]AEG51625.1 YCII-related protein [Sphingobium chlorophenolicum L-1]
MYFAIYALDKPDMLDVRMKTRAAHREYLHSPDAPVRLMLGGPMLADDGETMVGSLIVVEADSIEKVEAFSANDPYRLAGLVGSVSIRPWNWTAGNPDLADAS